MGAEKLNVITHSCNLTQYQLSPHKPTPASGIFNLLKNIL